MISLLIGQIISSQPDTVEILTSSGVGYRVFASLAGQKEWLMGKEARILTYLAVRENALDLFGFVSEKERGLFTRLLDVSGVGPKTALHILSLGSTEEISAAINRGDLNYLTKVSGIGKKTAERIVVELKDKMFASGGFDVSVAGEGAGNGVVGDVVDGLIAMGYSAQQAREVVKKLDAKGKTSEQLLREALQKIK